MDGQEREGRWEGEEEGGRRGERMEGRLLPSINAIHNVTMPQDAGC